MGGGCPEVTECVPGTGDEGYWSEGMSLSGSVLGEGAWGGWETGAMPCARLPGTRLSTPPPAPGRPPAAATLISPGGNLAGRGEDRSVAAARTTNIYANQCVHPHL